MKHRLHYILDILLFSFLTSLAAWGQVVIEKIDLSQQDGGYTIKDRNTTYIFTGEYKGTPDQEAYNKYKAVISVKEDIETTIILKDVTIKLDGKNDHIPFYFTKAAKITLLLEGKNVISGGKSNAAICVPSNDELIIDNEDAKKEGVLEVSGGFVASAIGTESGDYDFDGKISIKGGKIIAKGAAAGGRAPGIGAGLKCNGGTILINGGTVIASGSLGAPGIGPTGASVYGEGGSITITGGNVTATAIGGMSAPGIGIGLGLGNSAGSSEGVSIKITGGKVTATGNIRAPGIGKSSFVKGGSVDISGGTVKATGGANGMGIGAFIYASDQTPPPGDSHAITISGGSVTAINGANYSGPSIAGGKDETFSTGSGGNAFIVSNGIGDQSGRDNWQGVIIEKDKGAVYGTSVTLSTDADIPAGVTLINEKELIIPNGVNLTNNGTIQNKNILQNNGTLQNDGEILNDKDLKGNAITGNPPKHRVTCYPRSPGHPETEVKYITHGTIPELLHEKYKTFGWYYTEAVGDKEQNSAVNSIDEPCVIKGVWQENPIRLVDNPPTLTGKKGVKIKDYDLSKLIAQDDDSGPKVYVWDSSPEKRYGLTIEGGFIKGIPSEVTPDGETIVIQIQPGNEAPRSTQFIPISITLPTFYTITLPANPVGYSLLKPDGSPFSPSDLQVVEGTDFSFKLQLEPDYSESTPTVEASGVSGALTADPDGVYTIPAIQADTEIRVSGVIKNTPPPPPPAPSYYSLSIPATLTGAILHGGGTYTVEEGDCVEFRIELDPNGAGVYPAVYANGWNSLRPLDADGTYRVWVYEDTEIRIGEVPGYISYELSFPGDTVWQTDDTYYTGEGITVESLRADLSAYPFGSLIRLDAADTPHREFLEWFDGTTVRPYDLTVREGLEVRALFRSKSPVGNTPVEASGLRITTAPGCIDIRVSRPVPVCVYSVTGVLLRQARVSDTKRFTGLAAGIYLVAAGEERHKVTVR